MTRAFVPAFLFWAKHSAIWRGYQYFEEEFDYDQVIKLPKPKSQSGQRGEDGGSGSVPITYEHLGEDILSTIKEEIIGFDGRRIDREFYARFEDVVRENAFVAASVEAGEWDRVIDYLNKEIFGKPSEYYSLEKLRKAAGVDRRLSLREILEKLFGLIPRFKSKDDLLEEEFSKFVAVATASGASAVSPTARACDTQSFTMQTGIKSEIQIVFIPARSLSFL
jgi:type I restriction enzyme, R subunit